MTIQNEQTESEASAASSGCLSERFIKFSFALVYVLALTAFLWIFFEKHIPIVGLAYVYENWFNYVFFLIIGHLIFALYYSFSMVLRFFSEC